MQPHHGSERMRLPLSVSLAASLDVSSLCHPDVRYDKNFCHGNGHRERIRSLATCVWCRSETGIRGGSGTLELELELELELKLELELELELEIELELKLEPWEDLRSVLELELELVRARARV